MYVYSFLISDFVIVAILRISVVNKLTVTDKLTPVSEIIKMLHPPYHISSGISLLICGYGSDIY